jgi:hypothetical protein
MPAICSIAGRNFSSRRHPASIGEMLGVVRASRRTPTLSASCRTVWLRAEGVTPRRAAAGRKLRLSATAMKAVQIRKLASTHRWALLNSCHETPGIFRRPGPGQPAKRSRPWQNWRIAFTTAWKSGERHWRRLFSFPHCAVELSGIPLTIQ